MATNILLSKTEVDPGWVNYVKMESDALSRLDDFEIDNYADRELFNPDMQELLQSLDDTGMEDFSVMPLKMSFTEEHASYAIEALAGRFKRLKNKIRKIICEVFASFGNGPIPSWEDIIKAVLLAVAGSLFAGGIGAILLPVIIAFIAKIIRRGIDNVCPA